jgi:hypothetical protein
VAHLSRRLTGGAFDFDSFIRKRTSSSPTQNSNQTAFTYDAYGRVTRRVWFFLEMSSIQKRSIQINPWLN